MNRSKTTKKSTFTTITHRRHYRLLREEQARAAMSPSHDAIMWMLAKGLGSRVRARQCALTLISNYTVYELGEALYHRAYRVIHPRTKDRIMGKVRPRGKPGVLSETERAEYETRSAIQRALKVVSSPA